MNNCTLVWLYVPSSNILYDCTLYVWLYRHCRATFLSIPPVDLLTYRSPRHPFNTRWTRHPQLLISDIPWILQSFPLISDCNAPCSFRCLLPLFSHKSKVLQKLQISIYVRFWWNICHIKIWCKDLARSSDVCVVLNAFDNHETSQWSRSWQIFESLWSRNFLFSEPWYPSCDIQGFFHGNCV